MSTGESGTNNTAHRRDWETQRERLSAYLDGQLASGERAALEHHLPTCERCAAELADLRRTVALLRAMPAPALPRSFALPATATQDAPQAAPEPPAVAPVAATPMPRPLRTTLTPRRPVAWAGIAQWAGGLAAVAGLLVLLSGALAGLPSGLHMGGASTAAGLATYPQMHTPDHTLAPTPPANGTAGAANQTLTPLPSPTSPTPSVTPSVANAPIATPAFAPRTPTGANGPAVPVLPLTGGGLLLGGGLVFIAARAARRRAA